MTAQAHLDLGLHVQECLSPPLAVLAFAALSPMNMTGRRYNKCIVYSETRQSKQQDPMLLFLKVLDGILQR